MKILVIQSIRKPVTIAPCTFLVTKNSNAPKNTANPTNPKRALVCFPNWPANARIINSTNNNAANVIGVLKTMAQKEKAMVAIIFVIGTNLSILFSSHAVKEQLFKFLHRFAIRHVSKPFCKCHAKRFYKT